MMRSVSNWLLPAALCLTVIAASPSPALAGRTKVEWKAVQVPTGEEHDRRAHLLRTMLTQAARKADFGKAPSVALSARVVEMTSVTQGDVHRVSCTIVGHIVGGPTARSRISFGGRPAEREALEKQVLSMVANGLVARLAEIVRSRHERVKSSDGG